MANECYNLISFWGNAKVIEKVEQWKVHLRSIDALEDKQAKSQEFLTLFYPDDPDVDMNATGSKWVFHDETAVSPGEGEIGFRSAWDRPDRLEERLALLLYKIDKNVIVRNDYRLEDGSRGVSYISPKSDAVVFEYKTFNESNQDDYDDSEEAAEALDELIREEEIECIEDLISDKPSLVPVFKKFLSSVDIDWDDIYVDE